MWDEGIVSVFFDIRKDLYSRLYKSLIYVILYYHKCVRLYGNIEVQNRCPFIKTTKYLIESRYLKCINDGNMCM
jgi:hypothetical protein